MNTPTKLAGFAVIVALTFGGGYGAGQLYGPTGDGGSSDNRHMDTTHIESPHAPATHHDGRHEETP